MKQKRMENGGGGGDVGNGKGMKKHVIPVLKHSAIFTKCDNSDTLLYLTMLYSIHGFI